MPKLRFRRDFDKSFSMQEPNLFLIFVSRLNRLEVSYVVTGAVATILYGEPRLTHDIDLVIELHSEDAERFVKAFPGEEFYCPPIEVIRLETHRPLRGHFNLIHQSTGFKADVYLAGRDELHRWAIDNRRRFDLKGEPIWLAPPEYVIVRKLEYYREGGSEKHLRDIAGVLELSSAQIDFNLLQDKIKQYRLENEWQQTKKVFTSPT